jgi:signal transduction histidine kinase/CheY-like chemotaxis protein
MSSTPSNMSPEASSLYAHIEAKLLYDAYGRKRLNLAMTVAASVVGGILFWPYLPTAVFAVWLTALLGVQALGFLLLAAFNRAAPGENALVVWQRLFALQTGAGGAAWAVGPTLMIPQVTGPGLALYIASLLCVCAVALNSLAAQRGALQAFILAALLPPALALLYTGANVEILIAVVLMGGIAAMIAVGRASNRGLRALIETEFRLREAVLEASAAREAAERSTRAKSEFLSRMSHELRTPMNAVLGFAELLEYDGQLNDVQRDNVLHIQQGGRHLLELINEVLDLATIEAGRLNLKMEPVELASLVEECRALMDSLANARGISLLVSTVPSAIVRADRVRLKQALLNLLSNAVKYNRENGSVHLAVHIPTVERIRLTISDTGAGIEAARMAELFEPFNRLGAEDGKIEGTGIGLTITRRLIELMGGSVGVESEVGIGSHFWIELPPAEQPNTPATLKAGVSSSIPTVITTQRHQVLCVDDNPVNLHLIARILGKRPNIDVLTADTPQAGIELARVHRPDLIFLDISMPVMDGYQVLAALKSEARIGSPPIIAVSGHAMPRDIEKAREAGFAHYLTKPIQMAELHDIVDRYLIGAKPQA